MNAEIIAVGTELLLGDILNTNAQYLAQQLAQLGFTVHYQTVVGDNPNRLEQVLRTARARSGLLVLSGGLGPTEDDLTKQTTAQVFHDTLTLDAQELQRIREHFAALDRTMTPNNEKQALVPVRGGKFINSNGTAPGIYFEEDGCLAVLLPGPPGELVPMFENEVRPFLQRRSDHALVSRWLYVSGIPESTLDSMLATYLAAANPTCALYAKTGEVHIRITAGGASEDEARDKADATAQEISTLLGDRVYSDCGEELPQTVVHLLREAGLHLATAESCTGGLVAELLTAVSGCSAVFDGGVVSYSEEVKSRVLGVDPQTIAEHTVYSAPVAAQMALGAARLTGAEIGIGITGIAGPGGALPGIPVGTVFIAICRGEQVWVRTLHRPNRSRDDVRRRSAAAALDLVRRAVLGLPQPDAELITL